MLFIKLAKQTRSPGLTSQGSLEQLSPGTIQFIQTFPMKSANTNERYLQGFKSTKKMFTRRENKAALALFPIISELLQNKGEQHPSEQMAGTVPCVYFLFRYIIYYKPDLYVISSALLQLLTDLNILKMHPKRLASCSPPSHPRESPLLPR